MLAPNHLARVYFLMQKVNRGHSDFYTIILLILFFSKTTELHPSLCLYFALDSLDGKFFPFF